MTILTKDFYREQYNYDKRELEKTYDMFGLNQTQKAELRRITDRMIENQRKELNAPETAPSKVYGHE